MSLSTQQSICNQSALQRAIEYMNLIGKTDATTSEILGVAMSFAEFGVHGTFEISKTIDAKLEDFIASKK